MYIYIDIYTYIHTYIHTYISGPSPWGIWTFKGHVEVGMSNGSELWDLQFEISQIVSMRTDRTAIFVLRTFVLKIPESRCRKHISQNRIWDLEGLGTNISESHWALLSKSLVAIVVFSKSRCSFRPIFDFEDRSEYRDRQCTPFVDSLTCLEWQGFAKARLLSASHVRELKLRIQSFRDIDWNSVAFSQNMNLSVGVYHHSSCKYQSNPKPGHTTGRSGRGRSEV